MRPLIFGKTNNSQFRFALYPALMKAKKILLEFRFALTGCQLMPYSNISPMFLCDAKVMAKKFAATSFNGASSMKSLATNYRTKLFEDIQKMNQTRDPIADHIAGTSTITSSLHVKSLSQICCTARASAAKVVVDQQRKWVKTLQTVEADANLSWDAKAEARGLKRNLASFPILFSIVYSYLSFAILENLSKEL